MSADSVQAPTEAAALAARAATPTEDDALADLRNALQLIEAGRVLVEGKPLFQLVHSEIAAINVRLRTAVAKLANECDECGWDFTARLNNRRAKGHGVCVGCAVSLDLELHSDDLDDLSEERMSRGSDD